MKKLEKRAKNRVTNPKKEKKEKKDLFAKEKKIEKETDLF